VNDATPSDDPDDRRAATARAAFPLTANVVHLNTAAVGPVSTIYQRALARCTEEDVQRGRGWPARFSRIAERRERIRAELAVTLGCEPGALTLTQSTSDGFGQVVAAIAWQHGDEIVTTSVEHEDCAAPLRRAAARAGVGVAIASVPPAAPDDLEWLATVVTSRTRLIAFSGVGYETGVRLPIEAIARFARERGMLTLMDAAQCAGAMALGLGASGIDFCAVPLQKWICGPEGLGTLYIGDTGRAALGQDLRDTARQGLGILDATAAHLEWMRETLGWDWIYARIAGLARHLRDQVVEAPELSLVDSGAFAGLTTIRCRAADAADALTALERRHFALRHLPKLGAFRIATSFVNTNRELDDIVETLSTLSR
jgi:L-cysteine/cystine lyase